MLLDTDKILTTAQFAELVGSSTDTIKKYCQRGAILGIKAGNSWLIPKAEVDRFTQARRPRGRPPRAA